MKTIDHTILKADATKEDVIKICDEAILYDFASVCVNPCFVPFVNERLKDSTVKTCTVIGFPLGANPTEVKVFEANWAVKNGAQEIDMVINIGALKNKDYEYVLNDIDNVVHSSKEINQDVIVKVIIECCLLTNEEKEKAVNLCLEAKADFVKTSTGFSTGGATVEDVRLMKKISDGKIKIKASGGIKNYEDYKNMMDAGADRIGTSSGVYIAKSIK